MQKIVDFINSVLRNYSIDSSLIQNMQTCLGKEMRVDDWVSFILSNREYVVLKFNNGIYINRGLVVNDEKVLKVFGDFELGNISYNEETSVVEKGTAELSNGSQFEGLVLKDKDGKKEVPFGYGEMHDDDGILIFKGIMINWKRFGYGRSYYSNGFVEYEGYWCDDSRCGKGIVYDISGKFVNEGNWYNGIVSDRGKYEGNGKKPINIEIKHLKLTNNCVLRDLDVSLLLNLESISIGNDCFEYVGTFRIDGLSRLKTLKIGKRSFTQKKNSFGQDESKSFHVVNCESLEYINIGQFSFSDYGGQFELKNLPRLQFIIIGIIEYESCNFWYSSFMIGSTDRKLRFD